MSDGSKPCNSSRALSGPELYERLTIDRQNFLTLSNKKSLPSTISDDGRKFIDTIKRKTLREKETLLITSNVSFSLNDFHNIL